MTEADDGASWADGETVIVRCGYGAEFTDEDAFASHREEAGHQGRGFDVETVDEDYVQVYTGGMDGEE